MNEPPQIGDTREMPFLSYVGTYRYNGADWDLVSFIDPNAPPVVLKTGGLLVQGTSAMLKVMMT